MCAWSGARSFEWKVRPRFLAEFRCERERANAPCMPFRPLVVRFTAPVPRASLLAARLQPAQGAQGTALLPQVRRRRDARRAALRRAAGRERRVTRIALPPGLQDKPGRALANAAAFPMKVATGALPPIAKFAGAPFGIVEAGPDAMLPVTLRHVQGDLQGAATGRRACSLKRRSTGHELRRPTRLMRWSWPAAVDGRCRRARLREPRRSALSVATREADAAPHASCRS